MFPAARRLREDRLKDIFPKGFDEIPGGPSSHKSHFSYQPEQLCNSLVERYDPDVPSESIVITCAWYGKQNRRAQHEFIAIQVEDMDIEGLTNYLILDRNVKAHLGPLKRFLPSSFQDTGATDTFKISYNGEYDKLLDDCQLAPSKYLEMLTFDSDEPLRLYEVAVLADHVSNQHPTYNIRDTSCYMFAGMIWDCMHLMRSSAHLQNNLLVKSRLERGKCRGFQYISDKSANQKTYEQVQTKLQDIEQRMVMRRRRRNNVRYFEPLNPIL